MRNLEIENETLKKQLNSLGDVNDVMKKLEESESVRFFLFIL